MNWAHNADGDAHINMLQDSLGAFACAFAVRVHVQLSKRNQTRCIPDILMLVTSQAGSEFNTPRSETTSISVGMRKKKQRLELVRGVHCSSQ